MGVDAMAVRLASREGKVSRQGQILSLDRGRLFQGETIRLFDMSNLPFFNSKLCICVCVFVDSIRVFRRKCICVCVIVLS